MIRVLHVVTYMGRGGLETMLMNYYRHIDRSKVQFDFLTHRQGHFEYDDEIEELGGKIYHLPKLNPFSISYRKELKRFFLSHKEYKIIHVHQDCMSSVILKVAKECNVPVRIAHSHANSQDKNIKYPIKLFYKQFIPKYATELMACSKSAGDWMFEGTPYKVVKNAIDIDVYKFDEDKYAEMRKKLGVNDSEILIGHIGRFSPAKNHKFLIEVFDIIRHKVNAKLLLVGDGNLRQEIEKEISELGLKGNVMLAGVQTDVSIYLQAMDVFVLPSLYEGLGIVAIEAQAAGIPCVISDRIPTETIISDSVEIMSLNDKKELWADRIINLSKVQKTDTSKLVREAHYEISKNAEKLQNYYINALQNL